MLKRTKRRYLLLKIDSAEPIDQRELMDAIWNNITRLYGEYGASQTALSLIDYDAEKKQAIIRVANAAVNTVRASLAAVTETGNETVAIHVLAISGTLRALSKKSNQKAPQKRRKLQA